MIAMARLRRAILPLAIFAAMFGGHFIFRGLYRERDPIQERWTTVQTAPSPSWFERYVRGQHYWMGLSYGMSLGFVSWAVRRYLEERRRAGRTAAIGGLSLTGFLAVAGCFLAGCCGSPMLAVYINLLGAWFVPLAKPLIFAVTVIFVALGLWLMNRKGIIRCRAEPAAGPCEKAECD